MAPCEKWRTVFLYNSKDNLDKRIEFENKDTSLVTTYFYNKTDNRLEQMLVKDFKKQTASDTSGGIAFATLFMCKMVWLYDAQLLVGKNGTYSDSSRVNIEYLYKNKSLVGYITRIYNPYGHLDYTEKYSFNAAGELETKDVFYSNRNDRLISTIYKYNKQHLLESEITTDFRSNVREIISYVYN